MADQIFPISEIEIKYNPKIPAIQRPKITSSQDAYFHLMQLLGEKINIQEEFAILYVNRANRLIGGAKYFTGGITSSIVDIRIILAVALKCLATGLIIAHNHPSSELSPSKADMEITQKLKSAAQVMDIKLLDHLIITTEGYYSFCDEGIL